MQWHVISVLVKIKEVFRWPNIAVGSVLLAEITNYSARSPTVYILPMIKIPQETTLNRCPLIKVKKFPSRWVSSHPADHGWPLV